MRFFRNSLLVASLAAAAIVGSPYAYGFWLLINYESPVRRPEPLSVRAPALEYKEPIKLPRQSVNRTRKGDRLEAVGAERATVIRKQKTLPPPATESPWNRWQIG